MRNWFEERRLCGWEKPEELRNLEISHSQRPRFAVTEAATIRKDRGDAGESKGWDDGEEKSRVLKILGYHSAKRKRIAFITANSAQTRRGQVCAARSRWLVWR